jgi:CRISPR-associated protein Csx17
MNANPTLSVVSIPGLRPTSLGTYLAALGLLKILSRQWPSVRMAWHDSVLQIVGGPSDFDTLMEALMEVAGRATWTPYRRDWKKDQELSSDRKKKYDGSKQKDRADCSFDHPLMMWQSTADESDLEVFAAHIAPAKRGRFNPLLGNGGSSGNRDFSDGWTRAVQQLANRASSPDRREKIDYLSDFLLGNPVRWTVDNVPLFPDAPPKGQKKGSLNAASWFSEANKVYNSGQRAFSEGAISPWAMTLACEALSFFAGGASRRLGTFTRPVGAFPFVVESSAPEAVGEVGRNRAEIWAPLWTRPMTMPEATTLFARGRAEIGSRGAVTPAAFATAIMRRGVDAGVSEFRRFALGWTTSRQTFESRYLGIVAVPSETFDARSEAFNHLLGLIESLPRDDRKEGKRWRFVGLRGPLESALVRAAAAPADREASIALLDTVVSVLDRVDVNRTFREKGVTWRPLPLDWLPFLFDGIAPDVEARLALSLISAFPAAYPFAFYRFGAAWRDKTYDGVPKKNSPIIHNKTAPPRWIWCNGLLCRNLVATLQRRLLDWEAEHDTGLASPSRALITAHMSDVELWLAGSVNEPLLARWLSRLALFNWAGACVPARMAEPIPNEGDRTALSPLLALYGLLHPLFDLRSLERNRVDLLPIKTGARTAAAARRMAALLRGGDAERTIDVARSRYAMAGAPLMNVSAPWAVGDPERLAASLLFPVCDRDRTVLIQRWLRPQRQN